MTDIFAIDVGGAFIKWTYFSKKGAREHGLVPFELFRYPKLLKKELKKIKPKSKKLSTVLTMSGELCDSFASRAHGVRHIVSEVDAAFGSAGSSLKVFSRNGELVAPTKAITSPKDVASANWMPAPLWLSGLTGDFLFVDIGSTTTDITPVRKGKLVNKGDDDFSRLSGGELLYTGYLRTPVQSVSATFPIKGREVPVANEYFSIFGDIYLALGLIKPKEYNCPTPDGKGKTKEAALTRLARVVLSERKELGEKELIDLASQLAWIQLQLILAGIRKFNLELLVTGKGAFILDGAVRMGQVHLHTFGKGNDIKNLDPSHALALLVREGRL